MNKNSKNRSWHLSFLLCFLVSAPWFSRKILRLVMFGAHTNMDVKSINNMRLGVELMYNGTQSILPRRYLKEEEENEIEFVQLGSGIVGDEPGDETGSALSINADGSHIAISTWMAEGGGYVRIYEYMYQSPSDITSTKADEAESLHNWVQIGSDIGGLFPQDQNGRSISMNMDGDKVVIGAPASKNFRGSTRVFQLQLQNVYGQKGQRKEWVQFGQEITGDNDDDNSGESVAISGDGRRVALGAFRSNVVAGYVKIYENQSTSSISKWIQLGNNIVGEGYYDSMGKDISMNYDGNRIVVGKGMSNVDEVFLVGAVAVYEYNPTSSLWIQLGYDVEGVGYYDIFGESVDINADGDRIVLGVPNGDIGEGSDRGFARVYQYSANDDEWIQLGDDMIGSVAGERAGISVSMNMKGSRVVIGSHKNADGCARVFDLNTSSAANEWIQVGSNVLDSNSGDTTGCVVAVSGDGHRFAIGTRADVDDAGHVKVYRETSSSSATDTSPEPSAGSSSDSSEGNMSRGIASITVLFGIVVLVAMSI